MKDGLLCDKHILAASKLLQREFPGLQGLQSTLLFQTDGYSPISMEPNAGYVPEGKYITIKLSIANTDHD